MNNHWRGTSQLKESAAAGGGTGEVSGQAARAHCLDTLENQEYLKFANAKNPGRGRHYSFHLGGVGPASRPVSLLFFAFGNLTVPTETLKIAPTKFRTVRAIIDKSLVTILTTGLITEEARPPAILVSATSKTTISPSDQRMSMPSF